jgi:hypothetical protein
MYIVETYWKDGFQVDLKLKEEPEMDYQQSDVVKVSE